MNIFLPGTDQQLISLLNSVKLSNCDILVIGAGSEKIALEIRDKYESHVILILDDSDALLNSRIKLSDEADVTVKMMDYSATDFKDSQFDLVYAQASISNYARNKILKEIKRILKPAGYFSSGEIVSLTDNQPKFIKDMFTASGISPIQKHLIDDYYLSRGFRIIFEKDLSFTLKDFYEMSTGLLKETENTFDEQEKSFYKKLVRKISHESNIYLKLGGEKYYGFKTLLLGNLQV